eukprot:2584232-Rhodomonas_salina.2
MRCKQARHKTKQAGNDRGDERAKAFKGSLERKWGFTAVLPLSGPSAERLRRQRAPSAPNLAWIGGIDDRISRASAWKDQMLASDSTCCTLRNQVQTKSISG